MILDNIYGDSEKNDCKNLWWINWIEIYNNVISKNPICKFVLDSFKKSMINMIFIFNIVLIKMYI